MVLYYLERVSNEGPQTQQPNRGSSGHDLVLIFCRECSKTGQVLCVQVDPSQTHFYHGSFHRNFPLWELMAEAGCLDRKNLGVIALASLVSSHEPFACSLSLLPWPVRSSLPESRQQSTSWTHSLVMCQVLPRALWHLLLLTASPDL